MDARPVGRTHRRWWRHITRAVSAGEGGGFYISGGTYAWRTCSSRAPRPPPPPVTHSSPASPHPQIRVPPLLGVCGSSNPFSCGSGIAMSSSSALDLRDVVVADHINCGMQITGGAKVTLRRGRFFRGVVQIGGGALITGAEAISHRHGLRRQRRRYGGRRLLGAPRVDGDDRELRDPSQPGLHGLGVHRLDRRGGDDEERAGCTTTARQRRTGRGTWRAGARSCCGTPS